MALKQKLRHVLEETFPPPATVELRDDDRIIGFVVSKRFRRMEAIRRQEFIRKLLKAKLTPQEFRGVLMIAGITPEEEKAHRAMDD